MILIFVFSYSKRSLEVKPTLFCTMRQSEQSIFEKVFINRSQSERLSKRLIKRKRQPSDCKQLQYRVYFRPLPLLKNESCLSISGDNLSIIKESRVHTQRLYNDLNTTISHEMKKQNDTF